VTLKSIKQVPHWELRLGFAPAGIDMFIWGSKSDRSFPAEEYSVELLLH